MTESISNHSSSPSGIGGWLILPVIGLLVSFAMTIYNLWMSIYVFTPEIWNVFVETSPTFAAYLVVSFAFAVIGLVLIIYVARLLFTYDARTPKWYIIYLLYMAIVGVIEYGAIAHFNLLKLFDSEPRDTIRAIGVCFIWIPYFLRSVRVKNTFTRTK